MSPRSSRPYGFGSGIFFLALVFGLLSLAAAQNGGSGDSSDLSVAGVRAALAEERAAIAATPNDPHPYVQLAYTLSDAGMGEQARQAAADATRIAPRSAFAYSAQGWILRHNEIGVDFGKGFDYDGALHSYRKAIELDPNDLDIRESLANVLEYNRDGIEYGSGGQLAEAIDTYRYVKRRQSPINPDTEENLGIALFRAGRYEDALSEITFQATSPKNQGLFLAAFAALKGAPAAIALSNQIEGDQARKDALNLAAEGLWEVRLYPQAADLMTASLPDAEAGPGLTAKIQLFSHLQPYKGEELPPSDPRRPVQRLMVAIMNDALTDAVLDETLSRNSYPSEAAWRAAMTQQDQLSGIFLSLMKQTGLPRTVLADLVLDRMKLVAAPGPGPGKSVLVQILSASAGFFVLPENGVPKIVAAARSDSAVGIQALYLLAHQHKEEAASLLDWKRSIEEPATAADPLGGAVFVHLWTPDNRNSLDTPTLASAALIADPAILKPLVPTMLAARESAATDEARTALDLLLGTTYLRLKDAANAKPVCARLLKQYPESITAIQLAGQADALAKDWNAWKALLAHPLEVNPADRDLLRESAAEAEAEGDFARARAAYRALLDSGHAKPADYNQDAWLSLFVGKVDDEAIAEAQQATLSEKNRNSAFLHTLACLNATRGHTAEAHQELLDAMNSGHIEQPNAAIWLGFGLIDEQYGERPAAIAAYRKVTEASESPSNPPSAEDAAVSSYALAQLRLKALDAR